MRRPSRVIAPGYLALPLTAILFAIPYLGFPSHTVENSVGLPILCLVIYLGLIGARSKAVGPRRAACTVLIALGVMVIAVAATGVIELGVSMRGRSH